MIELAKRLAREHRLACSEYEALIAHRTPELTRVLAQLAVAQRKAVFGNQVYIRGLIEISNICKNDCFYCGIRRSNRSCQRYRLTIQEILDCCAQGWELGFRTFVLQGGEDGWFTDARLEMLIRQIKANHPDCAVTLSLGERSRESYARLRQAGADRYLLRHETASQAHYRFLHPEDMDFDHRMECLRSLKDLGYQVGCGFMVGSPGQTPWELAQDLQFVETLRPEMCGIGPFIPQSDTPFGAEPAGTVDETVFLLSILRLIHPEMLIPATTALGTLEEFGRERGILAGANVVMPNLSPEAAREKYTLYDRKRHSGSESAQGLSELRSRMAAIGYEITPHRGDYPNMF